MATFYSCYLLIQMRSKYQEMSQLNTTSMQDIAYACDLGRSSIIFVSVIVLIAYSLIPGQYLYLLE